MLMVQVQKAELTISLIEALFVMQYQSMIIIVESLLRMVHPENNVKITRKEMIKGSLKKYNTS